MGITCPACGLANESGARVCRNCGLPIAGENDPLRGVAPGRVDLPRVQRSGFSATLGLVLVIGLLMVGGTLAYSGGGILSTGGRLGVDATESASPAPGTNGRSGDGTPTAIDTGDPDEVDGGTTPSVTGTSFDYTCEDDTIKDLSRGKWFLSQFTAGERDGYDRITWKLSRRNNTKAKKSTRVTMEWTTPKEVRAAYGIDRIPGSRAILVTFNGDAKITADQTIGDLLLENENVEQIRHIRSFKADGKVRTVIGLRGDSCARMKAKGWNKGSSTRNAQMFLDLERFD